MKTSRFIKCAAHPFLGRLEAVLVDCHDRIRRLTKLALAGTLVAGFLSLGIAFAETPGSVEIARVSVEGEYELGKKIPIQMETFAPVPSMMLRPESIHYEQIHDSLKVTVQVEVFMLNRSADYRCDLQVSMLSAGGKGWSRRMAPILADGSDGGESKPGTIELFFGMPKAVDKVTGFRLTLWAMKYSEVEGGIEGPIILEKPLRIDLDAPGTEPPIELRFIEFGDRGGSRAGYLSCKLIVETHDMRRSGPWMVKLEILDEEGRPLNRVQRTFVKGGCCDPHFPMGDVLLEEAHQFRLSLIKADANAPAGISAPFALQDTEGAIPESKWLAIWVTAQARVSAERPGSFTAYLKGIQFSTREDGGTVATLNTYYNRSWDADAIEARWLEKISWQVQLDLIDDQGRIFHHEETTFRFAAQEAPEQEIRPSFGAYVELPIELSLNPKLDLDNVASFKVTFRDLPSADNASLHRPD
jgi:hypothetical protein